MGRGLILLSDRELAEHEAFLLDLLNGLHTREVEGVAVVAILKEKDPDGGDIISAYHNMSLRDRKLAADIIDTDVTYRMVKNILQDLDILPEPGEEE
ncbi:MAG: hypothetical protein E7448_03835 [Ruminococcaceae bacterium]|nr:hypothetical protein [Oscillospiraceae bacterium]